MPLGGAEDEHFFSQLMPIRVLLQNNENLKQNISEMSQGASLDKKARNKIGRQDFNENILCHSIKIEEVSPEMELWT